MIDLSSIKKYITEDNEHFDRCSEEAINDYGFDTWFNHQITIWMNCSYCPTGHRLLQTNEKRYCAEVTTIVNMINKFIDDEENRDKYFNQLLKQHNENLEFEAINGFEYDSHFPNKNKTAAPKKRAKQTSLEFGDKHKKETAAERKLKQHAAKISMLTFKIKPANDNNTV